MKDNKPKKRRKEGRKEKDSKGNGKIYRRAVPKNKARSGQKRLGQAAPTNKKFLAKGGAKYYSLQMRGSGRRKQPEKPSNVNRCKE